MQIAVMFTWLLKGHHFRLAYASFHSDRKSFQKCTSIIFSGTMVDKAEMYNMPTQSNFTVEHSLVVYFEGEFMFVFYSCQTCLLKDVEVKIILLLSYIVE